MYVTIFNLRPCHRIAIAIYHLNSTGLPGKQADFHKHKAGAFLFWYHKQSQDCAQSGLATKIKRTGSMDFMNMDNTLNVYDAMLT
jgi:hypothetical protein